MSGAQKRAGPTTKPETKPSRRTEQAASRHHASGGLLPRSRKKIHLPARLRWAAASIQTMIDGAQLEERRYLVAAASSNATTTNKIKISLSDTALHALILCHERFLQVLASELSTTACTNYDNATENNSQSQRATPVRSYVQVRDVAKSLDALGLSHLLKAAQANMIANQDSAIATQPSHKTKQSSSRRSRKRKEWSAAELEEQERLLARSKEKFEKNTGKKNAS